MQLKFFGRLKEIGFAHNVVPVENAARFVITETHGDPFRDPRAHEISHCGEAKIVED
jgi:hypothetical protein